MLDVPDCLMFGGKVQEKGWDESEMKGQPSNHVLNNDCPGFLVLWLFSIVVRLLNLLDFIYAKLKSFCDLLVW